MDLFSLLLCEWYVLVNVNPPCEGIAYTPGISDEGLTNQSGYSVMLLGNTILTLSGIIW